MWQGSINVRLFGRLTVAVGETETSRFRTEKTAALLGYLAYHLGRPVTRESLIDMLWPDSFGEQGRQSLRTALSSLRKLLDSPDGNGLQADRDSVCLNPDLVSTDVRQFERLLEAAAGETDAGVRVRQRESALQLVQGPLLQGQDEDWIIPQLLKLEEQWVEATLGLVADYRRLENLSSAVMAVKRTIAVAPLREDLHVALIKLYGEEGRSAEALRQFEELERLLDSQWGEAPSAAAVQALEASERDGDVEEQIQAVKKRLAASIREAPGQAEPAGPPSHASRANLPAELSKFFNRVDEIARIVDLLSPESTDPGRLLTVVGFGGCGKTRLSIRVASVLAEAYGGRVWFVPLASLRDPGLLPYTVGSVLIGNQAQQGDPWVSIRNTLAGGPSLLVLDNYEQVAEGGAPFVQDLLSASSDVRILVTSRTRLHVEGERLFNLNPLVTPSVAASLAQISQNDSLRLFVDRAKAVRQDFELTVDNVRPVAEICARLDGLPLALELAAGRVGLASPAQIVGQLAHRLDAFATKRHGPDGRHRNLRACIEWSYDLLHDETRPGFAAMSVFRNGAALEAIAAVTGTPGPETLLEELVEDSLLQAVETPVGMRFLMLETVREFARERLTELGQDRALNAHAAYFAALIEEAVPKLNSPDQKEWAAKCAPELDNFRAVCDRAMRGAVAVEYGLRVVGSIPQLVMLSSSAGEWAERCRALLAAAPEADVTLKAKAWGALGIYSTFQMRLPEAIEATRKAYEYWRQTDDRVRTAGTLCNLGNILLSAGRLDEAEEAFKQVVLENHELKNPRLEVIARVNLGRFCDFAGDLASAEDHYRTAEPLAEEVGDRRLQSILLEHRALIAIAEKRLEDADALLHESQRINSDIAYSRGTAFNHLNFGSLAALREDWDEAWRQTLDGIEALWAGQWFDGADSAVAHVACLAAAVGDFVGFARLAGYFSERDSPPLVTTSMRRPFEEAVATASGALGNAAYKAATSTGSRWSNEQAVEFALGLCRDRAAPKS
ncbi:MAG: tetratricopeptide repeat protein [Fimbriimonadaceae bacterium]|nr:tetratricopeptide repeat protein [Fimbriimonadaceae bacterium]QYK54870.1 MAG: tetratricopeptide repeat protein [Fimbriimonadaceae bacterium]